MKTKTLITALAVLLTSTLFAQATKGKAMYDVYVSSDDANAAAWISQMENSMLEIQFSEENIRTDLHMGDFMTQSSIMQKGQDTTLVLLDGMMGKIAMKTTKDDMDEEQKAQFEAVNIVITDETKKIMGYTCKKAEVSFEEHTSEVWFTEEIVPAYRGGQFLFEDIPGLPLELHSNFGNMKLKAVAYSFKGKIKKEQQVFSMDIPEGYTLRTAEEMKQMGR